MTAAESILNIGDGAIIFLLGLLFVICVLLLLVGFVKLLGWILAIIKKWSDKLKAKKGNGDRKKIRSVKDNAASSDEGEVIAAITAALMALYDNAAERGNTNDLKPPFIIKNIKRIK